MELYYGTRTRILSTCWTTTSPLRLQKKWTVPLVVRECVSKMGITEVTISDVREITDRLWIPPFRIDFSQGSSAKSDAKYLRILSPSWKGPCKLGSCQTTGRWQTQLLSSRSEIVSQGNFQTISLASILEKVLEVINGDKIVEHL